MLRLNLVLYFIHINFHVFPFQSAANVLPKVIGLIQLYILPSEVRIFRLLRVIHQIHCHVLIDEPLLSLDVSIEGSDELGRPRSATCR